MRYAGFGLAFGAVAAIAVIVLLAASLREAWSVSFKEGAEKSPGLVCARTSARTLECMELEEYLVRISVEP